VCAGCSLLCDDVTVGDGRFWPECPLGAEWYRASATADDGPDATVAGQPTDVATALARAVELLQGARRPLVGGFTGATVDDARAAVALADRLGAIVTADGSRGPWAGAPAFPLRGASTATLGEIRDRSEVVVVWREDPETTHPRLLERLRLAGAGSRAGESRASGAGPPPRRSEPTLAVLDDRDTPTAQLADLRLSWPPERDSEALSALHLLARGRERHAIAGDLRGWLDPLARRLEQVAHATFVYGGRLAAGTGGQRRALALHELVRELSHGRHVVTLSLAGAPGVRGADDVLTWQTGYAGSVDLGAGHPELVICTVPVVEHERVDVIVRVEDEAVAPGDSAAAAPVVVALSSRPGTPPPAVWIRTAVAGVGAGGTMHRLDGVPLALRPPRPSAAPSAAELLERLLQAVSAAGALMPRMAAPNRASAAATESERGLA
jgi:formylmethanofuran dehydrogenase subunit B